MTSTLTFELPVQTLEVLAERVAEIVLERLRAQRTDESPWLTLDQAAVYLGWPARRLYKRRDVPRVKHGNKLMFHRAELDRFFEALA